MSERPWEEPTRFLHRSRLVSRMALESHADGVASQPQRFQSGFDFFFAR
ncbi:hypothetical protein RBH26_08010 [Natronolimnohabitans sp. A-GB9]|nr:hypothetical protein [Natronolimnohabitans sp. A-GB9]MDQ2050430.1 hypothetical protein [Natronolimnohabitans sp. A-GB9]